MRFTFPRAAVFAVPFYCLILVGAMPTTVRAEGWDNIEVKDLIPRSRFVGVGTLWIDGKTDDGWLKGKLIFTQRLYSGIGEVKEYPVRVAPTTVPGKMQNWPSRKKGIWFILKSGDAYEPINHPGCWMDESEAKAVANQIYEGATKAYSEAKSAAQKQSAGGADTSDGEQSVAAYAAMAAAAATARDVPYQDKGRQSQQFYEQVMAMLETAGIKPPFARDLSDPAKQNEFFAQAKQMLGPAGAAMGELPGKGDPSRAAQLASAQNNVASIYLEFARNTLGSSTPTESLKKMGSIPLDLPPGGSVSGAGEPPGMPGPSGGTFALFQIPQGMLSEIPANGSRKQMLGAMVGNKPGGGISPGPGPRGPGGPPGGPRPGPR